MVVLAKRNQQDLEIIHDFFYKTIIPLTLVGYEMIIIANKARLKSNARL